MQKKNTRGARRKSKTKRDLVEVDASSPEAFDASLRQALGSTENFMALHPSGLVSGSIPGKRSKGRPTMPKKFQILDACAKVRAEGGHYTKLAARYRMTPKQLTNLVQDNRTYFKTKVRQLLKNA